MVDLPVPRPPIRALKYGLSSKLAGCLPRPIKRASLISIDAMKCSGVLNGVKPLLSSLRFTETSCPSSNARRKPSKLGRAILIHV
jgi:hypothetical protein